MSRIAVAFYYLTRVWAFLSRRFWQWVIDAYLRRNCKSYGSMSVYGHGRFANVSGLSVGQNIHVNFGPNWVCDGGLTIGDNVHISSNCTIYTRNHNTRGRALPYDDESIPRPVSIGRNTWIGVNVTILPGTQIGEGVIVGAGAVVHGTVPAFTILGASAPVKIGERDRAHYDEIDHLGHYGGPGGRVFSTSARRN
jgi:maltose O-acetyltransferase